MKKALIGTCMLAVACMLCAPAFARDVPHQPITSCANGTNPLMTAYGADNAGSLPVFSLGTGTNYNNPTTFWPVAGDWDFCATFDTAACSLGALAQFSADILVYQALFFCSTDINGPIDPEAELPVSANGIPDGNFELGLMAAIMNTPANPNSTAITNAYKANFDFFKVLVTTALANVPLKMDIRPLVPGLAPYLPNSLTAILAAYATEGDPTSVAAMDALLVALVAIGVTPPAGGVAGNTTGFPAILGPDGDADNDTFSNRQEYNFFKTQGAAVTIAAQLDANTTPPATVPKVEVLGAGTIEEGAALDLQAVVQNTAAASYAWSKNGAPLTSETASSLVIPVLALSDSGSYICTIVTSEKTAGDLVSSNPVVVNVVPEGTLPIAGGLGLALLAGACALGGVGSIRRRK